MKPIERYALYVGGSGDAAADNEELAALTRVTAPRNAAQEARINALTRERPRYLAADRDDDVAEFQVTLRYRAPRAEPFPWRVGDAMHVFDRYTHRLIYNGTLVAHADSGAGVAARARGTLTIALALAL